MGVAEGLFAIGVLPRTHRGEQAVLVMVVRCRDDDRIKALVFEQLAVIVVSGGFVILADFGKFIGDPVESEFRNVGGGHDAVPGLHAFDGDAPTVAAANQPDVEFSLAPRTFTVGASALQRRQTRR